MKSLIPVATFALLLSSVAIAPSAIAAKPNQKSDLNPAIANIPRVRALRLNRSTPKNTAKGLPNNLLTATPRLQTLKLNNRVAKKPALKPSRQASRGFLSALTLKSFSTNTVGSDSPAIYSATIKVPANAGRALQAIKIMQDDNVETVSFDPTDTKAMLANGKTASIASIGGAEVPGAATVVFNPPIQPGQTVTVGVPVQANPNADGIFLFGVTAFPEGENVQSQFLGFGRLHLNND